VFYWIRLSSSELRQAWGGIPGAGGPGSVSKIPNDLYLSVISLGRSSGAS